MYVYVCVYCGIYHMCMYVCSTLNISSLHFVLSNTFDGGTCKEYRNFSLELLHGWLQILLLLVIIIVVIIDISNVIGIITLSSVTKYNGACERRYALSSVGFTETGIKYYIRYKLNAVPTILKF